MSLPAMLLGETVGEILQASKFARQLVEAVDPKPIEDPKTPVTHSKNQRLDLENSEFRARRKREKQGVLQSIRTDSSNVHPSLQRAKSRINFKVSSPQQKSECDKENCKYIANRVSPRNRPWARKTVLFPNPLFHSSSSPAKQQQNQKFSRTKSPIISRNKPQTPHKFLIKSPPSKFHVKIRSPPLSISPKRPTNLMKKSPKISTAAKLRRSFSPSRLANKLVSPLKSRKSVNKIDVGGGGMKMMSGLKQRPTVGRPMRLSSAPRI